MFDLINLSSYREEVKQMVRDSRGKLPFDIRIKSMNDFIQSLLSSATGESPYNWLICEGSSEKIYLTAYLKDLIEDNKLRIVPVGGASEIKKIYNYLSACYKEVENEITGKIFLLSDTDRELVRYEVQTFRNLHCKRFVYSPEHGRAILVKIDSNPVSPATEIEDVLNGQVFRNTLISFAEEYDYLDFMEEIDEPQEQLESFSAFDLKSSQKDAITQFLDTGNNKFLFAEKYIDTLGQDSPEPEWIKEIRKVMTGA
ncbi:TOPRIM nucleotidyl transferase/hydrolase domain-containing protein [Pantoea ananatis]|uniref:TOPRIM nucleotidyl transferase/hydrolase domain-containing protein n=1 Tax=Pantoea ananas TaxID=553 RepID=UPI0021B49D2C|nr:TOPRIM nucleotidyl transferase/hydrolase domain-containing protein [Pantoea ananatis]